jgi:hypothetical protein
MLTLLSEHSVVDAIKKLREKEALEKGRNKSTKSSSSVDFLLQGLEVEKSQ